MTNGEISAEELEQCSRKYLENYALCASRRREELGVARFRDRELKKPLEYRTEYHRDRDRIIWSKAFKRLQHKTQIFPHYAEDHYRRRLTHSIEVAQIATTIARALKLNEVAVEAMALGHDLGHTPFGHSGEEALNKVTCELLFGYFPENIIRQSVQSKLTDLALNFKVPIYGFDHCSHSIEVISRLEKCKVGNNFEFGLNLTYDVREGILKHIYNFNRNDEGSIIKPYSSLENILKLEMYKEYNISYGSLEAQCVWISDKLSYLISDIEDGCRCKALNIKQVSTSALFDFINEKYYLLRHDRKKLNDISDDDDISDFLRNYLLPTIIINIIENSKTIISNVPILSYDDVVKYPDRIVYYDNEFECCHKSFYNDYIKMILFNDNDVQACHYKAVLIITELFRAYCDNINLIPVTYREDVKSAYKDIVPDKLLDLYTSRCYVAGMSDSYAIEQHKRLFMSSDKSIYY